MIIAVDFDGTIVKHEYPEIGAERPFAVKTLKMLQKDGHVLILWSVREGKYLDDAVEWCRERGLEFSSVNSNFIEEHSEMKGFSRKLKADIFIDDRNFGGLPSWAAIYDVIKRKQHFSLDMDSICYQEPKKKKSFFRKLLSIMAIK